MERLPYILIAAAIDKERLNHMYPAPGNPYNIAMKFCLERAFSCLYELRATDQLTHWWNHVVQKKTPI